MRLLGHDSADLVVVRECRGGAVRWLASRVADADALDTVPEIVEGLAIVRFGALEVRRKACPFDFDGDSDGAEDVGPLAPL